MRKEFFLVLFYVRTSHEHRVPHIIVLQFGGDPNDTNCVRHLMILSSPAVLVVKSVV